jgi:hypothetical protein
MRLPKLLDNELLRLILPSLRFAILSAIIDIVMLATLYATLRLAAGMRRSASARSTSWGRASASPPAARDSVTQSHGRFASSRVRRDIGFAGRSDRAAVYR